MHRLRSLSVLAIAATAALSLGAQSTRTVRGSWNLSAIPAPVKPALDAFNADAIRAHDWFLSSDLLEGRGPGTRGGQLAMNYIAAQFEALGLQPDGDNGTYFQKVSLLGLELDPATTSLAFTKGGAPVIGPLAYKDQFVGGDETQATTNTLDSEVVFVGHGVSAPEYRWDDYKGLDTRGKTLVMLVDDPPASAAEPDLFKGKARTYYGRWTYKYETGAAKNAAAVILIHTEEAAGYGWPVVRNSWGGERSYIRAKEGESKLKFAGWISKEVATKLFQNAGLDLATMTQAAASRDFKPVPLGVKFTGNIGSKVRPFDTANVVAKLPGSDPKLKDEAVLYTAHHDHLGIGTPDETGDTIYNGAIDNASGCALLIEMARVWTKSPRPKRSLIFAAVAAEEQGLLGSAYYGNNPTVPAGRIALNLNFDSIFQLGEVEDVTMNGVERTTFYPTAQKVTKALGLTIVPDQEPEQGHYYRSDHFSLGKVGVPAFSVDQGHDIVGQPAGWGKKMGDEYRDKHYHQPSDEFDPKWDWKPAVQMGQLGFWLGWEAANAAEMPNWKPGDEFRAARDRSLAAR
ncbi:MAG TPA: M28 family peptidase [Thermoanaerobaculia bacterium]|jgi:Zn-dependent M28 family amino/carboxypeptidase|nr:M28 family peptidase [Thermoanaerobaculia bacterium]